jgi:RND family efflux transporter MFP subunit
MRTAGRRVLAVCLAVGFTSACAGGDEEARPKSPTPVRVRVVAQAAGSGATRYSGTIEPAVKVDLAFKVGGYVRELAQIPSSGGPRRIQDGDLVKKGTVLAVVSESDYQQRISAARASLAEAVASQRQAQIDFDRATKLVASNVVPKAELDTTNAQRDMAVARAQAARAKVREAELELADCTVRAPFDGVVIRRHVEVGTLASPGTVAFTVADTSTVKVVFGAPDTLLDRLRIGDKVSVRLEALGKELTGDISRISPSADTRSRTFDVEATLANADDHLKVGMVASLKLAGGAPATSTLALPLTAVVRAPADPRGFAVFVVEGRDRKTIARIRQVALGDVIGNAVQVNDGLKPGERVIETGATQVADGEPVRVVR